MNDHGPRVCVATMSHTKTTETFIRAHIERLPLDVEVLSGPDLDMTANGRLLSDVGEIRLWLERVRRHRRDVLGSLRTQAVARHLRRSRIGVVLAEYGTAGALMAPACLVSDTPLVVHFHGYDASRRPHLERYADRYRAMFETAAAIVSVSGDMSARLRDLGAPPERMHQIPYGIDLTRFGGAEPGKATPTFLGVGRFVEKKAPHLLVSAFARVVAVRPEARLMLVGDGPLFPVVRQLVDAMGLANSVEMVGSLSNADVNDLMKRVRCFVQHSVEASDGDREGCPVAVLEAAASGLPVVATRHAGITESVVEGISGLLVDEEDVAGMADAMIRLVCDPALAASFGAAGRTHVEENFAEDRQLAKLSAVLGGVAVDRR